MAFQLQQHSERPVWLKFGASALFGVVVAACCVALSLFGYAWFTAPACPLFSQVQGQLGSHAWLLDRRGLPLQVQRRQEGGRAVQGKQLPWQSLALFPANWVAAIVASEDRHFDHHAGVDVYALTAAVAQSPWQRRGASTISMQLVRLLAGADAMPRTALGKLQQIAAALQLERQWRKEQILEAYLNLVPLRNDVRGIHTGQALWLHELPAEWIPLAGWAWSAMLPAPQASPERMIQRACARLNANQSTTRPYSCAELKTLITKLLKHDKRNIEELSAQLAPELLSFALVEAKSTIAKPAQTRFAQQDRVMSYLDIATQHSARKALREGLEKLRVFNADSAAAVVLDNATGEVVAYASVSMQVNRLDMARRPRTAASTLKPFLYAQALDSGLVNPREKISIRGRSFTQGPCDLRPYVPRDSVALFRAQAPLNLALAASSNVAAVDIVTRLGPKAFEDHLQALHLMPHSAQGQVNGNACEPKPRYGHALALGAVSMHLLDLSNAYRSLAQGGMYTSARLWHEGAVQSVPTRIYSEESTAWVSQTLASKALRFEGFGPDNPLDTPYWSASKTGTSDGFKDNWALGYSKKSTVGVWVGNADGSAMHGVFGPTGAAPIWRDIMDKLRH
jgi:penicillin-binding protein 1C